MPFMRDRLKKRRLDMGLTLEEVARELDVERPTVQRYESGKIKNISTSTLERLAKSLRCSPAYLMGWSDDVCTEVSEKLTSGEKRIINLYRDASQAGREAVEILLQGYRKNDERDSYKNSK